MWALKSPMVSTKVQNTSDKVCILGNHDLIIHMTIATLTLVTYGMKSELGPH